VGATSFSQEGAHCDRRVGGLRRPPPWLPILAGSLALVALDRRWRLDRCLAAQTTSVKDVEETLKVDQIFLMRKMG
jgi:hypothetical protein